MLRETEIFEGGRNAISGQKLFKFYENLICNKPNDFIKRRDSLKQIQSLLSKYTISVYQQTARLIELKEHELGQIEPYRYGYLYCSGYKSYYDYKTGLGFSDFKTEKGSTIQIF